jgi:hypothetical protein
MSRPQLQQFERANRFRKNKNIMTSTTNQATAPIVHLPPNAMPKVCSSYQPTGIPPSQERPYEEAQQARRESKTRCIKPGVCRRLNFDQD